MYASFEVVKKKMKKRGRGPETKLPA